MGGIAQAALGSMAGVMIADSVMGAFKGDQGKEGANAVAAMPTQEQQQLKDVQEGPCKVQYTSFLSK